MVYILFFLPTPIIAENWTCKQTSAGEGKKSDDQRKINMRQTQIIKGTLSKRPAYCDPSASAKEGRIKHWLLHMYCIYLE